MKLIYISLRNPLSTFCSDIRPADYNYSFFKELALTSILHLTLVFFPHQCRTFSSCTGTSFMVQKIKNETPFKLKNGMRHVKLIKFFKLVRLISGEPQLTKILPHLSYTSFRLCINVLKWRAGQLG